MNNKTKNSITVFKEIIHVKVYRWILYFVKACILFLITFLVSCHNEGSMNYSNIKTYAFRLSPGQDLKSEIEAMAKREKIEAGWIVTCVGSLTQTNIRYANQPEGTKREGHFEIVSLVGTVSTNGCHLHLAVSDSSGLTFGGHLLEKNLVYTTAEIVIAKDPGKIFTRELDTVSGWKELKVTEK